MGIIIAVAVYLIGFGLAFTMLRIEHEAETASFSNGDKAIGIALSLLSFAMVLYCLIASWVYKIGLTGYWKRPVKPSTK